MSFLGRSLGTFALAVLILTAGLVVPASAQVGAVKDAWLVMKVHSEFVNEDALAGSNIDVDVKHGMVTLRGTVPNEAARAAAIREARKNDGVKGVTDQLRIAAFHESKMDKAGDKMAKTADKAENKMDKAADKTVSGAKKTGRAIDDGWIKSKIYAQYMAHWNTVLDDSHIDVAVANNHVTLNGTVKSAAARAKAVEIAKGTDGVKSVKDNLTVAAGTSR